MSKFITDKASKAIVNAGITEFSGQSVAIDLNNMICKLACIAENWLPLFIQSVMKLKYNKIIPVFVLDGIAPALKAKTRVKRSNNRDQAQKDMSVISRDINKIESKDKFLFPVSELDKLSQKKLEREKELLSTEFDGYIKSQDLVKLLSGCVKMLGKRLLENITSERIEWVKNFIHACGYTCLVAEGEGEGLCASLCVAGRVSAVISEDTDVLVYGTPRVVRNIQLYKGTCTIISFEDVLKELELSKAQFLDLCICAGTDYGQTVRGYGICSAYKDIKKYKKIEKIPRDLTVLNHAKIRKLFKLTDVSSLDLSLRPLDHEALKCLVSQAEYEIEKVLKLWKSLPVEIRTKEKVKLEEN